MRIAVSAQAASASANLDPHFGRCATLVLYESDRQAYTMMDNSGSAQAAQGAGIQTAQAVINAGAEVVVTGSCGPKAFATLQAAGVRVLLATGGTVAEAVSACLAGTLNELSAPNSRGHRR
jgi:predicted Fe-Mo cluster-binding NifX family protein